MKKKMLKRRDYEHVITLEDYNLVQKITMWKIKEKGLLHNGKSKANQMRMELVNEKKYVKKSLKFIIKKTKEAELSVHNFCNESKKFDEMNEFII